MKYLILSLLLFSTNLMAETPAKEYYKQVFEVEIGPDSPSKIVYEFNNYHRSERCARQHRYLGYNKLTGKHVFGCSFKTMEKLTDPEYFTLHLTNSSGIKYGEAQKLRVEVFNTKRTGSNYDIRVTILDGPQDQIIKGLSTFSRNYKFTLMAQEQIDGSISDSERDSVKEAGPSPGLDAYNAVMDEN